MVLASASPRRADLLRQIGLSFEVWTGGTEVEVWGTIAGRPDGGEWTPEAVRAQAQRRAEDKARLAAAVRPDAVVVAADTMVAVDGVVLGKPRSPDEAAEMLGRLSGRAHDVTTAVVVAHTRQGTWLVDASATRVCFRPLRRQEILRYIATGEPMDKAGAYGIQGRAALFVERLEGDYFGVVGLPLALLGRLLDAAGVPPL
ncbi:MAG: Maf family protein [Armatimonadota bacterium]|nr:Maf family protein [Armatimonadota bacterium]MDR7533975.1 Maf family protein [Armatimonadota bacterium]MDR7536443.1 Maf family protein [Armatimonadota bacterium]